MDDWEDSSFPAHDPDSDKPSEDLLLEHALEEDEDKERSFSVPSSPRLSHRHTPIVPTSHQGHPHRLRSQSFDDILSSVNNEEDVPPSPSDTKSIKSQVSETNKLFHLPQDSDVGSEEDSEPEIPQEGTEIGLVCSENSQPALLGSAPDLLAPQGVGKFNRLKGKFLQRVQRGPRLQVPEVPQPTTTGSGSEDKHEETLAAEDSAASLQTSQMTHKLLTVKERFKNSSSLFRKMGVGGRGRGTSPQPLAPSLSVEEDNRNRARERSKSLFIIL